MITHVSSTSIYVNDQDEAIDFYVNKLGFELQADNPMGNDTRWVQVAPPGEKTAIILIKGYADWTPDKVGGFTRMVLAAYDVQATYATLSARGVHFTEPPIVTDWGMTQALFEDQDGNGYVLVGPIPQG